MSKIRWEYKVIDLFEARGSYRSQAERLNIEGQAGWELIDVVIHLARNQLTFLAYLKRPVRNVSGPHITRITQDLPSSGGDGK